MWYVYALYSKERNRFYVGMTDDLDRRLAEHRSGKTYTTARLGKWELAYYEYCVSKKDATERERQLKTGFGRGYIRRRLRNYINN